jgi:hypothetical protein
MGLGIDTSSATTSSSGQKRKRDERLDGGSRLKLTGCESEAYGNRVNYCLVHQLDDLSTNINQSESF